MGCASSKRVETAVVADVYRPPPTSIGKFDINTVEEPWLITATLDSDELPPEPEKKPVKTPALPILENLDSSEQAPQSWSEISKALENLKPSLTAPPVTPAPTVAIAPATTPAKTQKNQSFRTLEDLEKNLKSEKSSNKSSSLLSSPSTKSTRVHLPEGVRPVTQNSFLLRDKVERERKVGEGEEDAIRRWRRNPLDGFKELCPPGGAESVVLYTTSLRGVRRTFDECERARNLVELQCLNMVDVDERDISMHGEYLKQLRELLGEEATVPSLFVKGRYVGGVDEIIEYNDTGRLRLILKLARGEGAAGEMRRGCGGCGGARFVPCLECNGSRKVVVEKEVEVCGRCNENGLAQCPLCRGSE